MKGYAVRAMCSVFSLWLVAAAVPGISIQGGGAWLISALAVGLSNGLARTVIVFYVLPLRLRAVVGLSLAMHAVVPGILAVSFEGVVIGNAFAAVIGWLVLAGLASLITLYIGPDGTLYSLLPVRQRRTGP